MPPQKKPDLIGMGRDMGGVFEPDTTEEITRLSPAEEVRFRDWTKRNRITDVDAPDSFYDYRGYFKEYGDKPIKFGVDHFTDTYKQHGHPTFSEESIYSAGPGDGGSWAGETYVPPGATFVPDSGPTFRPSPRVGMTTSRPTETPDQLLTDPAKRGPQRLSDVVLPNYVSDPRLVEGYTAHIPTTDPRLMGLDQNAGKTIAQSEATRQRQIPYEQTRPQAPADGPYSFSESVLNVGQHLAKAPEVFKDPDSIPSNAAAFAFDTFIKTGAAGVRGTQKIVPDTIGAYFQGVAGGIASGTIEPMALLAAGAYAKTPEEAQRFVKPAIVARDFLAQDIMKGDPIDDPKLLANPEWWMANLGQLTGSILTLAAAGGAGAQTGVSVARGVAGRALTAEMLEVAAARGGLVASAFGESLLEASNVYVDKIEGGASLEDASGAAATTFAANAALLGLTEHPLFEAAGKGVKLFAKRALAEGGQEGAQTLISNKMTGRPMTEGLAASMLMGGIGGPIAGGVLDKALGNTRVQEPEAPPNPTARLVTPDIIDPDPVRRAERMREEMAGGAQAAPTTTARGPDGAAPPAAPSVPYGPDLPQGPTTGFPPEPHGPNLPQGPTTGPPPMAPEAPQAPPSAPPTTKKFSEMTREEKIAAVQAKLDEKNRNAPPTTTPPVTPSSNAETVTVYHGSAEIARRGTFEGFSRDIAPTGRMREVGKTMDSMGTWWSTSETDARSFGEHFGPDMKTRAPGALVTGEITLQNPKVFETPDEFAKFVSKLRTRDDITLPDGTISPGMKAARGDAIRAALQEHDGIIIRQGGKGDARPEGGDYLLAFDDSRFKVTNVEIPKKAPAPTTAESADTREFPKRNQIGSDLLERALTPQSQQHLDQMFSDKRAAKGTQNLRIAMEVYDRLLTPSELDVDLDRAPGSPALTQANKLLAATEAFFTAPTPEAKQQAAFALQDEMWSGLQLVTGKDDPDLHNDLLEGEIDASADDVGELVFSTLDPKTATFDTREFNSAYSMVEWRRETKPFPTVAPHERSVNTVPAEDRPKMRRNAEGKTVKGRDGKGILDPVPVEQRKGTYISQEEGTRQQEVWKETAAQVGKREDHSKEVIISLFDRTGVMSKPYEDAGYRVLRYDITTGQDLMKFGEWMRDVEHELGEDHTIVGILAQPPCTTYTLSGNRWLDRRGVESREEIARTFDLDVDSFHEKFKTPLEYAGHLVASVKLMVEQADPQFYMMENPAGTIGKHNSLPKSKLSFDPSAYGDPYTKQTHFWGEFNAKLPKANVYPSQGSLMQNSMSGGDLARSETPEGVAYAFFMVNNTSPDIAARQREAEAIVAEREQAAKAETAGANVTAKSEQEAEAPTQETSYTPQAQNEMMRRYGEKNGPKTRAKDTGERRRADDKQLTGKPPIKSKELPSTADPNSPNGYNSDQAQKNYVTLKRALTKAVNAKDWHEVIRQEERFNKYYEASPEPYPDYWADWQRHGDDARLQLQREADGLKSTRTGKPPKSILNHPPPGGWTDADKVPSSNRPIAAPPVSEPPLGESSENRPTPSAADVEREKLGGQKTAAQQRRADAIAKMKKAMRGGLSTTGSFSPPPELIDATIELIEGYVAEGITDLQIAWVNFKEDWGEGYQALKDTFELAWGMERGVEGATISEEPDGTTEQTQSDVDGPGPVPDDRGGAAGPDRAGSAGALEEVPPDAEQGAGGARAGGAPNRDPQSVVADGVSDAPDGGTQPSPPTPGTGGGAISGPVVPASGAKSDPGQKPQDYSLTPERIAAIVGRGDMQRVRDNLAAIRLLKEITTAERHATPQEQEVLAKYVGWGASEAAKFLDDEANYNWRDTEKALWREIKEELTPEERTSLIRSTPNAHFTFDLYTPIWSAIEAMGFSGGRVLEPAVGVGHAIGLMPPQLRANSTVLGTDLDPITAKIAALLYPSARIQAKGYEVARIPRNTQDLIISNVPFGAFGVEDALLPDYITSRIHNYFFAKALEHARPGGYVVFITSRYTMDGQESAQVRRYLMERAHFVGAVRLSNEAFGKSAKTEVVTDVIVLQKFKEESETARNAEAFIGSSKHRLSRPATTQGRKRIPEKNIYRSDWYAKHPELILGTETTGGTMYGGGEYTVESNGALLEDALAQVLPPGSYEPASSPATSTEAPTQLDSGTFKTGEFRIENGKVMQVASTGELVDATPMKKVKGKLQPDGDSVRRITLMVGIRDALRETVRTMQSKTSTDEEVATAQRSLKKQYDTFQKAFGDLNAPLNKRLFENDPEATNLAGLETIEPQVKLTTDPNGKQSIKVAYKVIGLSDIFTKRTINAPIEITKADTPTDALLASLGTRTTIDWPYMARIYSGSDSLAAQSALKEKLTEAGHVFEAPDGAWYTTDEYLSGDVVSKLEDARAMEEPKFARNIAALEKVQPRPKTADDPITLSIGAHWIPKQHVASFIDDTIGLEGAVVTNIQTERVVRWNVAFTDEQMVRSKKHDMAVAIGPRDDKGLVKEGQEVGVYGLTELVDDALNLKTPQLGWWIGHGDNREFIKDPTGSLAARANIEELRSMWLRWVAENPKVESDLLRIYNERFNRTAKREFDGSHLANFKDGVRTAALPGLALPFALYKHQLTAVWRILTSGNTLLAHEVGAGKTFEMIVTAMEMRRTGRARKPMITVPTYLLQQWKKDIVKAYPQAKILAFDEKDLSSKKRQQAMARIAFGDWDIVLVPHSSFELLNVSDERMAAVLQEWVDELIAAEKSAKTSDPKSVKQLETDRRKLEDKIKALLDRAKSADKALTWDQLGVDALMVDEAQAFKNLYFTTKLDALRGLSRSNSDRALDLFIKVKEINESSNHRNLVLATATPIMNSLAELYTMQRYLQPDRLKELGFANFDNWYAMFAEALPVVEQRPDGSYHEVMRLKEFRNLQLLYNVVAEVMDYVGWKDMPYLKLPKIRGGRATVVETNPHPVYPKLKKWFTDRLTELRQNPPKYNHFTKTYTAPDRKHPLTGESMGRFDNILTVMTDAKLAAIDPRLVLGSEVTDFEGSRLQAAAKDITRVWNEEKAKKGVSLVFIDAGTPPGSGNMEFLGDLTVEDATDGGAIGTEDDIDAESDLAYQGPFNMYDALKAELVKRGIPSREIAFIHDAKSPAERLALFAAVNEGKVRVLFASTDKGGVGMNAQQRMAALFHFDAPRYGRPGDIRQRLGRMVRQGNSYGEPGLDVQEYRYITKGTTDEWLYGLVAGKAHGIEQFMRGEATNLTEDDPSTISIEEAQIRAANDPRGIELMETRAQLKRLDAQAASAERAIGKANNALATWEQKLPALKAELERFTKWVTQARRTLMLKRSSPDLRLTRKGPPSTFEIKLNLAATKVKNQVYKKHGEANVVLIKQLEQVFDNETTDPVTIGEYGGLPIKAYYTEGKRWRDRGVVVIFDTTDAYGGGDVRITEVEAPTGDSEFGEGRNIIGTIVRDYSDTFTRGARLKFDIREGEGAIAAAKATLAKPFDVITKARKARARVLELETELKTESEQRDKAADAEARDRALNKKIQDAGGKVEDEDDDDSSGMPRKKKNAPPKTPKPPPPPPLNAPEDLRARKHGPPTRAEMEAAEASDIKPSTIIKALTKAFGTPVNVGGLSSKWLGIFKSPFRSIRLRHANTLSTAIHEFGHDFDYAITKLLLKDKRWMTELRALGQLTSKDYYTLKKELKEGAAEFFVLYLSDPDTAKQAAPNYFAAVEDVLQRADLAPLKQALDTIRTQVQQYALASDEAQGRRAINRDRAGMFRRTMRYISQDPGAVLKDLQRELFDGHTWFNFASKRMAAGVPLNMAEDPAALSQIAKGSGSKAEGFFEVGVRGMDGRFLSGSLKDALKPIAGRIDEWEDYMVALRVEELIEVRGRERPGMSLAQAKAIIKKTEARTDFSDFEDAREGYWKFKDAVLDYAVEYGALSLDQVTKMREMNRAYIPLKRVQEEVETYFGGGRNVANRRSPIKRIGDSNLEIVAPLEAVTSDVYAIVDYVEKNRAMQAFTDQVSSTEGSAKWMEKWPTPMVPTTFNLNEFTGEIKKVLDAYKVELPDGMDLDDAMDWMLSVWKPQQFVSGKDKLVTVMRDGKREFWKVNSPGLYEALTMEGPRDAQGLMRFLQKPSIGATNVLRTTATSTPSFIWRNIQRDSLVALLQSRYGFIPIWDHAAAFVSMARGDADMKLFMTSGVAQATLVGNDRKTRAQYIERQVNGKVGRGVLGAVTGKPGIDTIEVLSGVELVKALYAALQHWSMQVETATRLAEFKLALDTGGEERTLLKRLTSKKAQRGVLTEDAIVAATRAARDVTTDFQRGGTFIKRMSRYYAFLNARTQGWVRLYETAARASAAPPVWYSKKKGVELNLRGEGADLVFKLAGLATVSALLWALNKDDDEWKEKQEWEKSSYWFIRVGDNFVRIAKPFEWGAASNIMEAALEYSYENGDNRRFNDIWHSYFPTFDIDDKDALHRSVLNMTPQALLPLSEAVWNYSAFRDAPLWNPWERGGREKEFSRWTSESAKVISKYLMPIFNPAQIDHMISGYTSNFGRATLEGGDMLIDAVQGKDRPARPTPPMSQRWFLGAVGDSGDYSGQSQSIQDIYQLAEAIAVIEKRELPDGEDYQTKLGTFTPEQVADIKRARALFADEFADRIKEIYAAPPSEMSPHQKRVELNKTYREMIDVAREALGKRTTTR